MPKLTHRWRPAFPGEGPKSVSAENENVPFSPERAAMEADHLLGAEMDRDRNRAAALERRVGFPSYLRHHRNPQ